MKTLARWIGALVLPFVAMFIVSILGTIIAYSNIPTPWHDPEDGVDGLALLGASFASGCIYSGVAHSLAPAHKNAATATMVAMLIAVLAVGAVFCFGNIGKFGVLRYLITTVGAVVATVAQWRKYD